MKFLKFFAIALLLIFMSSCTDEDANFITSAVVNNEGHLILTYQDGTIADQGLVIPEEEVVEVEYHLVNFYSTEGYIISTQIIEHEEAAFAPTLEVPEHMVFDMWDQDFSSITDDINIHPIVTENTFTISFHNPEMSVPDITGIQYGESVALPAPQIAGKEFLGWFIDDNPYATMASMYGEIHGDMELYARYEDIVYTITYHTNGGTDVMSQEALYGDMMVMPVMPMKEDYFYNGWYYDNDEMMPVEFDTPITEDKEIYVSWIQFEVYLHDNITVADDEYYVINSVIGEHNYVHVPTMIDEYEVGEIGYSAFRYEPFIEVYLPDTLIYLQAYSFADMPNLTSIVLPDSIQYVSDKIFSNSTALADVILPSNMNGIGSSMFENTAIESITIPEGYEFFGSNAFKNTPLVNVNIPASLETVGAYSFENTLITEMILPEGLTYLGSFAFKDCQNLISVSLPESLSNISNNPFIGASNLTSVTLSETNPTYELIDDVIYNEAMNRLEVYLPYKTDTSYTVLETIVYFDYDAMSGNPFIETLILPDILHYFYPDYNFYDMDSLSSIEVYDAPGTSYIASENGALYTADYTTLYKYPMGKSDTAFAVNSSTTIIYTKAFKDNTYINSVVLNNGIQRLYNYAFENCTNLSAINFPTSLQYIYSGAFYNVDGITSITLPNTILSIGYLSFAEMDNLSSLTLNEGLTYLPDKILENSNNVTSLHIPSTINTISSYALTGSNGLSTVTIDPGNIYFNVYNDSIYSEDYTALYAIPGGHEQESYYIRSETIYVYANFGTSPNIKIIRVNSNVQYFYSHVSDMPNLQGIVFFSTSQITYLYTTPFNIATDEGFTLYVRESLYDDYITDYYWEIYTDWIVTFN